MVEVRHQTIVNPTVEVSRNDPKCLSENKEKYQVRCRWHRFVNLVFSNDVHFSALNSISLSVVPPFLSYRFSGQSGARQTTFPQYKEDFFIEFMIHNSTIRHLLAMR